MRGSDWLPGPKGSSWEGCPDRRGWTKPFDVGTARLGRRSFLLVAFGFALLCLDPVHAPRFLERLRAERDRAARAWPWVPQVWTASATVAIGVLFAIRPSVTSFPYASAVRPFLGSRGWPKDSRQAVVPMSGALAAIALPIVVGSILTADGTVLNALPSVTSAEKVGPG